MQKPTFKINKIPSYNNNNKPSYNNNNNNKGTSNKSNVGNDGDDNYYDHSSSSLLPSNYEPIVPPKNFGTKTLQRLFQSNILFKNYNSNSNNKLMTMIKKTKNSKQQVHQSLLPPLIHGTWNLKDFWELVSWPTDSEGGNNNIRYGLPVVDDLDSLSSTTSSFEYELDFEDSDRNDDRNDRDSRNSIKATTQPTTIPNPYVKDLNTVADLNQYILEPKEDCVLFLSAPYCRTCRYLAPQYTKLARSYYNQEDSDIIFAKTNTSDKLGGKEISKILDVDAVPAFCLFRAGERYGTTLSLSRIPSRKLDAALDLLLSGEEWDWRLIRKFSK